MRTDRRNTRHQGEHGTTARGEISLGEADRQADDSAIGSRFEVLAKTTNAREPGDCDTENTLTR